MIETIDLQIKRYFGSNNTLSKGELVLLVKKDFPNWSDNTINAYLYNLKKKGIINTLSRGIYILDNIQTFNPLINSQLKKIASKIHKNFPFINYCVWDTIWLNDLMRHQPLKQFTVIEVEKGVSEQVFNSLNKDFNNLFLNPDSQIYDRYLSTIDHPIIIKNLYSESPTIELKETTIPALEKILVDILIDDDLYAAQQGEKDYIFQSAFDKYTINILKMKRYAARRNRNTELENILDISLSK